MTPDYNVHMCTDMHAPVQNTYVHKVTRTHVHMLHNNIQNISMRTHTHTHTPHAYKHYILIGMDTNGYTDNS